MKSAEVAPKIEVNQVVNAGRKGAEEQKGSVDQKEHGLISLQRTHIPEHSRNLRIRAIQSVPVAPIHPVEVQKGSFKVCIRGERIEQADVKGQELARQENAEEESMA